MMEMMNRNVQRKLEVAQPKSRKPELESWRRREDTQQTLDRMISDAKNNRFVWSYDAEEPY